MFGCVHELNITSCKILCTLCENDNNDNNICDMQVHIERIFWVLYMKKVVTKNGIVL